MADPKPISRWTQLRIAAIAVYAVVSIASLVWALPGRGGGNALGAVIAVGQTGEGTVFLTVRNQSRFAWNDVVIIADDRYLFRADPVPPGGAVDARLREFDHIYRLLRPTGLYLWDDPALQAPPGRVAVPNYWPHRIRVQTREATVEESTSRD